jgi:hypothetical protein
MIDAIAHFASMMMRLPDDQMIRSILKSSIIDDQMDLLRKRRRVLVLGTLYALNRVDQ